MAGGGDCAAIGVLDGEEFSPRVIFIGCDQLGIFVSAGCDLPLVERFNVTLCVPAIVVVCAADADANVRAAFIVAENVRFAPVVRAGQIDTLIDLPTVQLDGGDYVELYMEKKLLVEQFLMQRTVEKCHR